MRRNRREFRYKNVLNNLKTPVTNSDGYLTGEYLPVYGLPKTAHGIISGAKSNAYRTWYGIAEEFDKVIVPEGIIDIDESSLLWVDNLSIVSKPDYKVVRISRTANTQVIYIKKVT